MKRSVSIRIGAFASQALAAGTRKGAEPTALDVESAIRCYLGDKSSSNGPGWAFPDFLREKESRGEVELRLAVDETLWRALEVEAASQGVNVRQMLEHAALYFAAEVNAGRVTQRILDDLDQ